MSKRQAWFIGSIVMVCVLVLAGTGFVVATAHGAFGTQTTAQNDVAVGVTHVDVVNDMFTPAHIQVALGTTVTWTNRGTDSHNVTISPAVVSASGNWESGLLDPGQSFSYTFTTRGTFQYYCQEHHNMTGIVTVT